MGNLISDTEEKYSLRKSENQALRRIIWTQKRGCSRSFTICIQIKEDSMLRTCIKDGDDYKFVEFSIGSIGYLGADIMSIIIILIRFMLRQISHLARASDVHCNAL
jgi:hypothetical protein